MPRRQNGMVVPDAYQGREQAYVKHRLLGAYLEKLFLIVGMGSDKLGVAELCYVDCFAGPWGDESEGLGTTSIAISLDILARCRIELLRRGKALRFRALYVEKSKTAFALLERHLRERTPEGIDAKPMNGDFVDLRQDILDWCGAGSFAFFFIDPKGWTDVGVNVLKPLLQRPQSEFLITFMYDFVNRTVSMQDYQNQITQLLGGQPEVGGLAPQAREKALLHTYRRNLKACIWMNWQGTARSAYVRVQHPTKDRTKYHLVYLTSHPLGVVEFMNISEKLDLVQKLTRAATKQSRRIEKSKQTELFGADEFVSEEEGHASPDEIEIFWLERLSLAPRLFGLAEFADMLEEKDWFPGDLQQALGHLMVQGKVANLDAKGKRKSRYLHFEVGERLQLTGDKP